MTSSPSIKDLLALCKLKVVSLILLTAVVGMLLAVPYVPNLLLIVIASIGISLSAMSAAVFNHIIDEKIDFFTKQNQMVVTANNKIIWVCGHRLSDIVKVHDKTSKFMELSLVSELKD